MTRLLKQPYERAIRPRLPRKLAAVHGYPVRHPYLFDFTDVEPYPERDSVNALREQVRDGDDVLVVGGGYGVTTIVAAEAGADVVVYEGAASNIVALDETMVINGVSDRVVIREGLVAGTNQDVWGAPSRSVVDTAALPESDVVELDCEGAELEIVERLSFVPRVLITEVHPDFGVSVSGLEDALRRRGMVVRRKIDGENTTTITASAGTGEDVRDAQ